MKGIVLNNPYFNADINKLYVSHVKNQPLALDYVILRALVICYCSLLSLDVLVIRYCAVINLIGNG